MTPNSPTDEQNRPRNDEAHEDLVREARKYAPAVAAEYKAAWTETQALGVLLARMLTSTDAQEVRKLAGVLAVQAPTVAVRWFNARAALIRAVESMPVVVIADGRRGGATAAMLARLKLDSDLGRVVLQLPEPSEEGLQVGPSLAEAIGGGGC